jgi:hypothetical protein
MARSVARDTQTQRHRENRETPSRVRPESYEEGNDPSLHEQIAQRAYVNWQSRGCPLGSAEEDWFEAERQMQEQQRLAAAIT